MDSLPLPTFLPTLPPPAQPNLIHSPKEVGIDYRDLAEEWLKLPRNATQAILFLQSLLPPPATQSKSQLHVLHPDLIRYDYY